MDGLHGLPYYARFLTKFVFDILPAALASVIGGFLFTQYHATRTVESMAVVEKAAPAQMEEAMRMVRDEHSLLVDFLKGQQAETTKRNANFDQARAKAVTETREAAQREAAARESAARESAARDAATREAAQREAANREGANREAVMAALRRHDAEQAKLATVEPARLPAQTASAPAQAPMSIGPASVGAATANPATAGTMPLPPAANIPSANVVGTIPSALATSQRAANDLRPPADIPNEPRRTGPIGATIGFARDVTDKAVSTVLEIPGWIGDRILGAPSSPAPNGRLTSSQW